MIIAERGSGSKGKDMSMGIGKGTDKGTGMAKGKLKGTPRGYVGKERAEIRNNEFKNTEFTSAQLTGIIAHVQEKYHLTRDRRT